MNIGIDISALQTGHRMRGIGATIINFINHISAINNKDLFFTFYLYEENEELAMDLLNLKGIDYKLHYIKKQNKNSYHGKLNRLFNLLNTEKNIYLGDRRISSFKGIDVFIQPDQNTPLPPKNKVKSILFLYDAIPFVLKNDYLFNYKTARNKGMTRKGSLRQQILRSQYKRLQIYNCKRAVKVMAISNKTKNDFIHYFNVPHTKIQVCYLGVDNIDFKPNKISKIYEQINTCWGYKRVPLSLEKNKYLLFVGGVDARRKIIDLVAAYNNLKARGYDMSLVLAGDALFNADNIPNIEANKYFKNTSYMKDVHFLGYISDDERSWLYENALAFVYPSIYEGFGLPVLEAMKHQCPVITYNCEAIKEVAGDSVYYAKSWNNIGIMEAVISLINIKDSRKELISKGNKMVNKFSWKQTSSKIIKIAKEVK